MLARIVTIIAVIFFNHIFSVPLFAQDSATALPAKWDLQTCLDYAKKNNIQLNNLRLTAQSNEQDLLQSKAARYPNLIGSTSHTYTHSKNANPVVGGFQTQSSFSSSYSLNSSWTVYNGGYLNNDVKQKQLLVQSANLNLEQTENDITLQITQAYLNILLAKESIVYAEDLVKTSQAQVEQGQQQFNAGSIARIALVELQAQAATDKYNLVTAQSLRRQNLLTLKQLLQLPSDTTFDIVAPDTLTANALVPSLEEVQRAALETRPEIRNAQLGIQIAQFNLLKAKAAYLPTAIIGSGISSGYSNNESSDYLKQLDNNFYQRIGLTLSIPIFNNRITRTNVEKSKIAIEQANLNLQGAKTVLSQEVEQAYINVLNAQGQYDAAVEQLRSSQEGYRIAAEQLKVGVANTVEFLQQKTLYTQALQAYIQAKYNSALNIKIYDFYRGIPVKL